MAIVCPSCEARFREPPKDISPYGPFQCGKCEHEWEIAAPRIKMDAPALTPELEDLSDKEIIRTNLPVVIASAPPAKARRKIFVDTLAAAPQKTQYPVRAMLIMSCVALFAGILVFKDAIMSAAPSSLPFYQAAGLAPDTPGLSIANIVTTKSTKDGIRQLIVRGEVQNIADNTVPVPPLKLIMRGKSNANLYAWTVSAAKPSLKAGETSRFTAVAHNIPKDAVNVEVEFQKPAK